MTKKEILQIESAENISLLSLLHLVPVQPKKVLPAVYLFLKAIRMHCPWIRNAAWLVR
jgi:hypothetical protein